MLGFKNNTQYSNKRTFSWKRLVFLCGGIITVCIISMVLFIQFDTEAAANFTDDVLRPLLGNNNVIFVERIFFNSSDRVRQFIAPFKNQKSPFIENGNSVSSFNKSSLDLNPIVSSATTLLAKEGEWQNIPLDLFPKQIVMADTFIRPDPSRSYAFVTLVQMDMSALRLWSVAGTIEPASEVGKPGAGVVPKTIQDQGTLVAAFDGGFQYKDGQYGMIVGNETYLPLQNDVATLVGHKDGRLEIIKYEGQYLGNDVAFVRQNCPMLIENGVLAVNDGTNRKLWGRTTTWQIRTWRSGIGITAQGNLVFAIGNALVPSTLADALKAAGAVNAMQLDINPNWVRFNVFNSFSNGQYTSKPIMDGISDGTYSFLHGDRKDFFYVTKKS